MFCQSQQYYCAAGDSSGESLVKQKLDNLVKMAKRDNMSSGDIIYYAVAQIYVDKRIMSQAAQMLKKSIQYNEQENRHSVAGLLLLADIKYDTHEYVDTKNYYDSVSVTTWPTIRISSVDARSPGLGIIRDQLYHHTRRQSSASCRNARR